MTNRKNNVAANIKTLRRKLGFSQDTLAGIMLVNKGSVLNWENGHTMPSLDYVIQLANVFGVSLDELVFGEIKWVETDDKRLCRENYREQMESFGYKADGNPMR